MPARHYHYDALDRVARSGAEPNAAERFYNKNHLATELHRQAHSSVLRSPGGLLAVHHASETLLLSTDQQQSVLRAGREPSAYDPYGKQTASVAAAAAPAFNGEWQEAQTGHYVLGNGYRAFMPSLRRFNRPDSWSPFGRGGLNCYGYCAGDPINRSDPSGHAGGWAILRMFVKSGAIQKAIKSPVANLDTLEAATLGIKYAKREEAVAAAFREVLAGEQRSILTLDHHSFSHVMGFLPLGARKALARVSNAAAGRVLGVHSGVPVPVVSLAASHPRRIAFVAGKLQKIPTMSDAQLQNAAKRLRSYAGDLSLHRKPGFTDNFQFIPENSRFNAQLSQLQDYMFALNGFTSSWL